ncbi:alpha/beta hydrolase [Alkalibacter mobilis]|uniref:alpha/beta hydrolase n=1 Tax=Alkalibacter mobilis TaxID=2787712 RepID=UPI0018A0DF04|nr:alpha/beta hydrolase [Alkalibacter mobilis]MBF7096952.1 alpha/beta hydrolase [Alkalibacter mobilis]
MKGFRNVLIEKVLRVQKLKAGLGLETINSKRKKQERRAAIFNLVPGVEYHDIEIDGMKAQLIEGEDKVKGRIILYLHGGTFCTGSVKSYRILARKLADVCASEMLIINYRLAPENKYPKALNDAIKAYKWILEKGYSPQDIYLMGDSAGGGLALSTVLAMKKMGISFPAGIVCMSPWTNLSLSFSSMANRRKRDPMLVPEVLKECASLYCGNNVKDPLVSPVYGDFKDFPPVLLQVGTEEILYDDSVELAKRLERQKVDVTLEIWKNMFHVWQFFYLLLPESKLAVENIGKFIEKTSKSYNNY